MKTNALLLTIVCMLAAFGSSCSNPAVTKIVTPAVQAQIIGDAEKDLFVAGGAFLVTGGNGAAAVAALTAQEIKNIPDLQAKVINATPAVVTGANSTAAPVAAVVPPAAKALAKVTP